MLLSACSLQAQNGYWEEAKGPYGGEGHLFLASDGKLIFNSYSSFAQTYISSDGGIKWDRLPISIIDSSATGNYRVSTGYSGNFYKTLEYPNGDKKVFRSSDNANSWNYAFSIGTIHTFKETSTGTLIGADSTRLYRSLDGGQQWSIVYEGSNNKKIKEITIGNNGNLWAFVGSDSLLRSQNDGLTWSRIKVPSTSEVIYVTNNGTILLSNAVQIHRSTNNGQSFQSFKIDTSATNQVGRFCTLTSGRVLFSSSISTSEKLFYSDNNGITWHLFNTSFPVGILYNLTLQDGTIFCSRTGGLYRSSDGGTTWTFASNGINSDFSKLLFFSSDTIVSGRRGVLQRTFDGGENWHKISHDSCERGKLYALYDHHKLLFMLNERLFLSSDGGNTHIDITPPVQIGGMNGTFDNWGFSAAINPVTKTFIVSNPIKSFRSTDEGQTWIEIPNVTNLRDIQFTADGTIYAINNDTWELQISMDDGITWEFALSTVENLWISKNNSVFVSRSNELLKWDNNAMEWTKKRSPFDYWGGHQASEMVSNEQGFLFAFFKPNYRLSMSLNEGETWQSIPWINSLFNYEYIPNPLGAHLHTGPDQLLYLTSLNGMFRSSKSTLEGAFLRGSLFRDEDDDCLTYETSIPLKNWIVRATNIYETYTTTNQQGEFVMLLDTGMYNVSVAPINGIWWDVCDSLKTVALEQIGESDTLNFSALPLANCPLMSVNIATPQLRRCFNNIVYVGYCNQGTESADSAWVDVILDPFLTLINSDQPHEVQSNGAIRFFVGDVATGDCGQFELTVYVNCDSTVLGQTHCISAHGFPDTLCTELPAWSGANIRASATCQDSVLQLILENDGIAPSQTLEYIIIEDDIVLFSGQKNYTVGESITMEYPANGSTWRIESAQEPGHPFSTLALAFAEGCGGFESLGYINQFPVNGSSPSWHRMCVENVDAYDPNDKQGFPIGTGMEHNIRPGQTIDYLVRFQNTGTDTAFTVIIRDTLSVFLDPSTVRPGASSHAYTWSLSGQGVINFTFNNIMLPDSNVNEPASNGFVQFSITPYLDVPLGSVIENDAAIYFDFNEPVITNTTWHTIQKSPLTSALWSEPQKTAPSLLVWPNPFNERISVRLNQKTSGTLLLKIYDSRGTLVAQKTTNGPEIELNARQLPAGLYWAEVRDAQGRLLGNGKLVKE